MVVWEGGSFVNSQASGGCSGKKKKAKEIILYIIKMVLL